MSGQIEVYVSPFPSTGQRWRVSADGGSQARWRRDGSEIFYLAPDRKLIAASVTTTGDEFTVKGYEPLFEIRLSLRRVSRVRRHRRTRSAFS